MPVHSTIFARSRQWPSMGWTSNQCHLLGSLLARICGWTRPISGACQGSDWWWPTTECKSGEKKLRTMRMKTLKVFSSLGESCNQWLPKQEVVSGVSLLLLLGDQWKDWELLTHTSCWCALMQVGKSWSTRPSITFHVHQQSSRWMPKTKIQSLPLSFERLRRSSKEIRGRFRLF